jgi:molybdopterin-guanine dinucleotide biosynthesis protein A
MTDAAIPPRALTLAIVAGGKGERMGGIAKGLLRFQGRTILERLLVLRARAEHVLLVGKGLEAYKPWNLETVEDVSAGYGAPGGVVSALLAAPTPWVLVTACDMPFVTVAAATRLLEAAATSDGACFTRQGRLEPLLGVYAASLGDGWKARLTENPSFQVLFQNSRVTALPEDELLAVDPTGACVRSVNTWEEAQAWGLEPPA